MDEHYLKHPTEGVIRMQDLLLSMSIVKLLPILRTTIPLFLIDYNHSYDDVNTC